jgi:hypothetical protein
VVLYFYEQPTVAVLKNKLEMFQFHTYMEPGSGFWSISSKKEDLPKFVVVHNFTK